MPGRRSGWLWCSVRPRWLLSPLLVHAATGEQGPGNGATCFYDPEAPPPLATIAGSGLIPGCARQRCDRREPGAGHQLRRGQRGASNDIICGNGGDNDVIVGDAQKPNPASSAGSRDLLLGGSGDDVVLASAGRDRSSVRTVPTS